MTDLATPQHDFFVGIDSDGCVFDTMEVKHKECFIPNIIKHYNLASVSKYARECAEFVNLYSKFRGINRFPALVETFDLLADRDEVKRRGVTIPQIPEIRRWIEEEDKLGNPALAAKVEKEPTDELKQCLTWSKGVNDTVDEVVHNVPPFPNVRECLEKMADKADMLVVSATPNDALGREWEEHTLRHFVRAICGQESGSKKETLALKSNYAEGHALMIGDAPGDMKAAKANNVLFYPINPGAEEESWKRFLEESLELFFAGKYAGAYEEKVIAEFHTYLPDTPPWK